MEYNKYYGPSYMVKEKLSIDERFKLYILNALPGQGLATHMGTYYLINDLKAEVDRLRIHNAELEAKVDKAALNDGMKGV
jgi:hypothetical protein